MIDLLEPSGVKGAIINTLCDEWPYPLTAKKIYNKVRKNFGLTVTYQAVHKTLKQFEHKKIASRVEKGYALDIDWVRETKSLMLQLESKYYSVKGRLERMLDKERVITIVFKRTRDVGAFIVNEFLNLPNPKNEPLVFRLEHLNWMPDEQLSLLKQKIGKIEIYIICQNRDPLDKLLAKNFEKLGAKVKLGVSCAKSNDSVSLGDFTIQVFKSSDYQKSWGSLYKKIKGLDTLDLSEIRELLYDKKWEGLKVIVGKNPRYAKHLRKLTLPLFRK